MSAGVEDLLGPGAPLEPEDLDEMPGTARKGRRGDPLDSTLPALAGADEAEEP